MCEEVTTWNKDHTPLYPEPGQRYVRVVVQSNHGKIFSDWEADTVEGMEALLRRGWLHQSAMYPTNKVVGFEYYTAPATKRVIRFLPQVREAGGEWSAVTDCPYLGYKSRAHAIDTLANAMMDHSQGRQFRVAERETEVTC